jgi:uncharacterized OsmC-like protein
LKHESEFGDTKLKHETHRLFGQTNFISSQRNLKMTPNNNEAAYSTVNNGVNVEALLGAREALDAAPEAAQFKWRAQSTWIDGTHSRTTISNFFGLGEEQSRGKHFTIDADHPEVFAAKDMGATPVELVLSGLASCLTAGVASVAQNRGIQLKSVTATLEGDMDLQGILGIDSDVRNGFQSIRVMFDIDADASKEDIEAVVAQSQKRSAVFDIITNPTNVFVEVN